MDLRVNVLLDGFANKLNGENKEPQQFINNPNEMTNNNNANDKNIDNSNISKCNNNNCTPPPSNNTVLQQNTGTTNSSNIPIIDNKMPQQNTGKENQSNIHKNTKHWEPFRVWNDFIDMTKNISQQFGAGDAGTLF